MKNLKLFISGIALTLFVGSTAFASAPSKASNKKQLRTELIKLLGNFENYNEKDGALTAYVSFIVTDENQVLVISVDSENKSVDSYVKSKLNYKNVVASGIKRGEIFIMPLKIQKQS